MISKIEITILYEHILEIYYISRLNLVLHCYIDSQVLQ